MNIINTAIAEQVDFVILAGDLFQKRAIDALTLNSAMRGLERLAAAKIPCISVEGNHELAYYNEAIGWLRFLAERDLLVLLDPSFHDGTPQLVPYTHRQGAYIDPVPGIRVYGLRYMGSSTPTAVAGMAEALAAQPQHDVDYTIFVAHTGVEGVLPGHAGGLTHTQLAPLRAHVDYLALGHVHKPFTFDNWIYNAGSIETCSMEEVSWNDRGYYLVEIDTSRPRQNGEPAHIATLHPSTRRPFCRIFFKVDLCTTPADLFNQCRTYVTRRAVDLGIHANDDPALAPVVELHLSGVLPFDRSGLDMDGLKKMVEECFNPLLCQVKNGTQFADFAVEADESLDRRQLERQIVADLLSRDARFKEHSEAWTDLALDLKGLALGGAGADEILDTLGTTMTQLNS